VFLKLPSDNLNLDEEISKAQNKMKKVADSVSKQRKLVDAPDFKEKVSSAVQEEENKKLAEMMAQQSNYERTIEQFHQLKLESMK